LESAVSVVRKIFANSTGRWLLRVAAATIVVSAVSCSATPTEPRPVDPTPTPPRPNEPPIVSSLTVSSDRAEADNEITVTASVTDAETPLDQLTYQWSAMPVNGQFVGTGSQVRWRAPRGQRTPDVYTLRIVVTERYVLAGEPRQNEVGRKIQVHYNDSPAEIMRISMRFLTELFPDFNVSPQAAVQDFSDNCSGKVDELNDVTNNRRNFHILSGTYTNVSINLDAARTSADVSGVCTFVDIPTNPTNPFYGRRESVTGICMLTAVYENWRWFLCTSHFRGLGTMPLELLRYRVPGRIVSSPQ
jgi:hypothetical protein